MKGSRNSFFPEIFLIADAIEPITARSYEAPSLLNFTSEVLPPKAKQYPRPAYQLIETESLSATLANNAYFAKHLKKSKARYSQGQEDEESTGLLASEIENKMERPVYLCIGDKRSGKEPGFEYVRLDDEFWEILSQNISFIRNRAEFKTFYSALSGKHTAKGLKDIVMQLIEDKSKFAEIFSKFLLAENNKLPVPFTIRRIKQDYDEPNMFDNVGPSKERCFKLKITPRLKEARRKENLNAIREAINNDISTEMGFNTQVQQLRLSHYQNGKIKFVTDCILARNYQDLGDAYKLSGDKFDPFKKKGLFRNFLTAIKSRFGAKSTNPPLMGTLLSLQLLLEDPDFIGAYAQNKGVVTEDSKTTDVDEKKRSHIFILDVGKGLRGSYWTKASKSLQDNGHFELPISAISKSPLDVFNLSRHYLFRNSSILYDVPFSENMLGFHILRKFVDGKTNFDVIKSYGPEAQARMAKVKSNGLAAIFQNHIDNLKNLKATMKSPADKEEMDYYIKEVKKTRDQALANARNILNVFQQRLELTAPQINLLSNLEKLTSKTYDLSDDGKVQISNLQVESKSRIPWELKQADQPDYYHLTCDLTKNPLLAEDANWAMIQAAIDRVNHFLAKTDFKKLPSGRLSNTGEIYTIVIRKDQLEKLCEIITAEAVHDYKIPLHSTAAIIEITKNATKKFVTDFENSIINASSFFSKKYSVIDPVYTSAKAYQDLLKTKASDMHQQNILMLIASLGILESKNKDLTKQLLNALKCDSFKTAKSRIFMQIISELQILNPSVTDKEINTFNKKITEHIKLLNQAIKKPSIRHPVSIKKDELIDDVFNWLTALQNRSTVSLRA